MKYLKRFESKSGYPDSYFLDADGNEIILTSIEWNNEPITFQDFVEINSEDGECHLPDFDLERIKKLQVGETTEIGGGSPGTTEIKRISTEEYNAGKFGI